MSIKAIIFDCFGVLIMAGHSLIYRDYPGLKEEIIRLQFLSDSGKITRQQFDEAVAKFTGLTIQQVENRYWSVNTYNQPMLDWAKQLKQSGEYKIGMLSNINRDWMDIYLPFFDREKLFDAEILSGDVNLTKPDPAIFKLMADNLGLRMNECVMIDDVIGNINGAKQSGMQGIVYVSKDQAQVELEEILRTTNA